MARVMGQPLEPGTEPYYERTTLDSAVQQAKEKIEEWDYHADPHGYCHERPMLVALVKAAEKRSLRSVISALWRKAQGQR